MNWKQLSVLARLCLLMTIAVWAAPATAQKPDVIKEAAKRVEQAFDNPTKSTGTLGIIAAVIGLLGTGVPVLLKAYESISIRSKAKELDRIEDLVALMKKTKKEQVLSESTLTAVCGQIELEIQASLESLAKSREHRQLVLNRKRQRRDPDLTLARSVFLLYRPHGLRAWSAQVLAYVFGLLCLGFAILIPIDFEGWLFAFSFSVLALFLCLLFRMWAVSERRRWRKAQESGTLAGSASIFFRPHDLRGWVALLVPLSCLVLICFSLMAFATFRHPLLWFSGFVLSLPLFWLSKKWALNERKRWQTAV